MKIDLVVLLLQFPDCLAKSSLIHFYLTSELKNEFNTPLHCSRGEESQQKQLHIPSKEIKKEREHNIISWPPDKQKGELMRIGLRIFPIFISPSLHPIRQATLFSIDSSLGRLRFIDKIFLLNRITSSRQSKNMEYYVTMYSWIYWNY